jgi:cell fate regulator YaaT (PSP1 superfamily)
MIVQFFEWGNLECVSTSLTGLNIGDKVVVQHKWGLLLGTVVNNSQSQNNQEVVGQIIRKATPLDLETVLKNKANEQKIKKEIKKEAKKNNTQMKVIEIYLSIDGGNVIVIFTANSRVDFRELVKKISTKLGKTVRFQQIGARDEAKKMGGLGICGRELCCSKFSRGLRSITTDMARFQVIAHRGSERLSGLCGRLMCCLAYESKQYEELSKNMPKKGTQLIYKEQEVTVIDNLILDEKVKILFSDGKRIIVDLKDVQKNNKVL